MPSELLSVVVTRPDLVVGEGGESRAHLLGKPLHQAVSYLGDEGKAQLVHDALLARDRHSRRARAADREHSRAGSGTLVPPWPLRSAWSSRCGTRRPTSTGRWPRPARPWHETAADHEIIIVNDASTDRTGELADALAREDPRIKVVHHAKNRKLGGTLRSGYAVATKELVLYSDADLPFDFQEVDRAVRLLEYQQADVLAAYRFDRTSEGLLRTIYTIGYSALIRTLFRLRFRDVNFSFKLFRRALLDRIVLKSEGSFIDAEFLVRAKKAGAQVIQIGVDYFPAYPRPEHARLPQGHRRDPPGDGRCSGASSGNRDAHRSGPDFRRRRSSAASPSSARAATSRCAPASWSRPPSSTTAGMVFAASNLKKDRLGEALVALGRITDEEFSRVSALMKGDRKRRFGEALVASGVMDKSEMGTAVARQVRRIVVSLFELAEGAASFEERRCTIPLEYMVSVSVSRILYEGIRLMKNQELIQAALGAPRPRGDPRPRAALPLRAQGVPRRGARDPRAGPQAGHGAAPGLGLGRPRPLAPARDLRPLVGRGPAGRRRPEPARSR